MGDGEEEFDEGVKGGVEGLVPIEAEDSEVDVVTTKRRFEHRKTNADALETEGVHLLFGDVVPTGQNTAACNPNNKPDYYYYY